MLHLKSNETGFWVSGNGVTLNIGALGIDPPLLETLLERLGWEEQGGDYYEPQRRGVWNGAQCKFEWASAEDQAHWMSILIVYAMKRIVDQLMRDLELEGK